MKKYFMGIKWINELQPMVQLKRYDNGVEEIVPLADNVRLKKINLKVCSGTVNPYTQEYSSCNEIINLNEAQCYSCMHKFDFYNCVKCHGSSCKAKSQEVINYCNTSHYVYLAYFPNGKIKVGTASEVRKYIRLLEQGAIFSMYIAKTPNGKIARQIEKNIIDCGITGIVTTAYKMKNLICTEKVEEVKKQLFNTYRFIIQYIELQNNRYLIEPEFNFFGKLQENLEKNMLCQSEQINMFDNQLENIKKYENSDVCDLLSGKFLFAVGKIVALESEGIIQLYDSKKYEGFLFEF